MAFIRMMRKPEAKKVQIYNWDTIEGVCERRIEAEVGVLASFSPSISETMWEENWGWVGRVWWDEGGGGRRPEAKAVSTCDKTLLAAPSLCPLISTNNTNGHQKSDKNLMSFYRSAMWRQLICSSCTWAAATDRLTSEAKEKVYRLVPANYLTS